MFAGLPGIGVGTLFYVLTALVMPFVELDRSLRGDVSAARWRLAIQQFCFAIAIVASVALADRLFAIILHDRSIQNLNVARLVNETVAARAPESIWAAPVMASVLLLAGVLVLMEVLRWMFAKRAVPASAPAKSDRSTDFAAPQVEDAV